ncbi:serine/threonine protein kinase [Winogradskyella ursingii]|uniref:serine/threonine protein kinase n=1 Tax=Winogradskyella ursingii TaxID=2686079 RepID=UPI0015C92246|nr:serine/threonine-protein kinase [Winogradskyella ursingii]
MSGIGSQYEIIQKLGEGGMGMVYLAKDTMINRLVAIKQLHRNTGSEDESLGERFQSEAHTLAKLNHLNITHLYSFIPKEDTYWMIMEYVEGKTLEDWLLVHKKITHQLAASIAVQVLDGLDHAHRKGIIHRDIKPANVMINDEGEVKIMDFGIARMRNSQRLTNHGKSVGTLEYMAPEQIQGHEGDERTDVYAVGNLLYEMLCGTTPFQSDTDYQLMKDKLEKQPDSILWENPTVPVAFEKIIIKALHRNPNKRYKSVLDMKFAIEKCLKGALIDQASLSQVLQASQVFTEPQNDHEIISVSKILSRAKTISDRFKVPAINFSSVNAIKRPYLILGASILLCMILLIWSGGRDANSGGELPQNLTAWEDPEVAPTIKNVPQTSDDFDETPSEMYERISNPPKEKTTPRELTNLSPKTGNNNTKKVVNVPLDDKLNKSSKTTERDVVKEEKAEKKPKIPSSPIDVPRGQTIRVTLMETITSEEVERDGTVIRLICNENVVAENHVIIRKGAVVRGKIVDCIPSSKKNRKALIGFVIQGVDAVDGSNIKLRSERYKLFAEVPGNAVSYRSGQTFEAKLKGGKVFDR